MNRVILTALGALGAAVASPAAASGAELTPRDTHSVARFDMVLYEIPANEGVERWCQSHNKQYADDLETGRRETSERLDYCASWDGQDQICYITLRYGLSRRQQEHILGDAVAHCALNAEQRIRQGS